MEIIAEEIKSGKPFFGICLGLQLLMEDSEESPGKKGLGIIKGTVKKFPESDLKIPHMGWNEVNNCKESAVLKGVPKGADFYFVHSYYVLPEDNDCILAETNYGESFCSAIEQGNVFACQFHPEKSQEFGLKMIKNFFLS